MSGIRLFFSYLWDRRKNIVLLVFFGVIFAVVFWLYGIRTDAVLYAGLLSLLAAFGFAAAGFFSYRRKYFILDNLKKSSHLSEDNLPPAANLNEREYRELAVLQSEQLSRTVSENDRRRTDTEEYYLMWAHQIKTPIAAARLLLSAGEPNKSEMSAELLKIEQYVEMALGYQRLNSDETDFMFKKYDVADIVRQAVRKNSRLFVIKKLCLEFEQSECVYVITDEKWLLFAIEQILVNAVKYTNEGGNIRIYFENSDTKRLIIEDSGIGIAPEDLPRVFEKGYTGYNGRLDKKSTGIGLFLTKETLKKIGHSISIESEVGIGTRVCITLTERREY